MLPTYIDDLHPEVFGVVDCMREESAGECSRSGEGLALWGWLSQLGEEQVDQAERAELHSNDRSFA